MLARDFQKLPKRPVPSHWQLTATRERRRRNSSAVPPSAATDHHAESPKDLVRHFERSIIRMSADCPWRLSYSHTVRSIARPSCRGLCTLTNPKASASFRASGATRHRPVRSTHRRSAPGTHGEQARDSPGSESAMNTVNDARIGCHRRAPKSWTIVITFRANALYGLAACLMSACNGHCPSGTVSSGNVCRFVKALEGGSGAGNSVQAAATGGGGTSPSTIAANQPASTMGGAGAIAPADAGAGGTTRASGATAGSSGVSGPTGAPSVPSSGVAGMSVAGAVGMNAAGAASMPDKCDANQDGSFRCAPGSTLDRERCMNGSWLSATACATGEVCSAQSATLGQCVETAAFCIGKADQSACDERGTMYKCNAESVSESPTACASARHCQLGLAAGTCATCLPGEHHCNEQILERCEDNGSGFRMVTPCPTAALCNETAGACTDKTCSPGQFSCANGSLLRCNAGQDGWDSVQPCSADLCDA